MSGVTRRIHELKDEVRSLRRWDGFASEADQLCLSRITHLLDQLHEKAARVRRQEREKEPLLV